jgi:hypothetical protein
LQKGKGCRCLFLRTHCERRGTCWLIAAVLALGNSCFYPSIAAQQKPAIAVDGYITAMHSPTSFDVHGKQVTVTAETNYGFIGKMPVQTGDGALHDALQLGAFVQVSGPANPQTNAIDATAVFLRDDLDHKVSGFGVIDKVISTGPETIFRADGYVLRITPATDLTFGDKLKSLTDVGTNTWVHYQGKRTESGSISVSKATFLPAQNSKLIAALAFEIDNIQVKFLHSAHKEKLRYSQSETVFRVIDDPSLQKNIERIGASLIPAYQKALPNDDPSKIHFEFYAVDSQSLRWEVCTRNGMILLPKLVIDRLKSDDQIAAVLADGLAFDLQRQAVGTTLANRAFLGANAAADVAAALVPGANIPVAVGSTIAARAQYVARQKQRGRIALALMNDAGYDLAQAPEAWRLLTPKNLPANPDSLKYPDESIYQMSVIYQQYRDEGSAALR